MAQTTFTVLASADDGKVSKSGLGYPPPGTAWADTTFGSLLAARSNWTAEGERYEICVGLMRWNTSVIPAGSTIVSAQLRVRAMYILNYEARSLRLEWYASGNWPISADAYAQDEAGDAGTFPLSGLVNNAYNTLDLATVTGIIAAGWTGMRLHLTGGEPTDSNQVGIASKDNTDGYDPPQLIVIYDPPPEGYQHKALGCLPTAIAKIMGIPIANIAKFNGV